jgi:hypothetical protein
MRPNTCTGRCKHIHAKEHGEFCSPFLSRPFNIKSIKLNYTPWPKSTSELYRPSNHCLSVKLVPTFCRQRVSCGQCDRSPWPYPRFSRLATSNQYISQLNLFRFLQNLVRLSLFYFNYFWRCCCFKIFKNLGNLIHE